MRKEIISTIAAGAVVAAAMLGAAGVFAPTGSSAAPGTTLNYTAKIDHESQLDAVPKGPSAGDQQLATGGLWQGDQQVGRFGFVCELLTSGQTADEDCRATGRVNGGSFTLMGFSRLSDSDHTWAVVGGTGAYRSATGQMEIHDTSDGAVVTIELG